MIGTGTVSFLLSWKAEFQLGLILLIFTLAWFRGGGPEKASAGVFLGWTVVSWLLRHAAGHSAMFISVETGYFLADATVASLFILIALIANRLYPLWLSSIQLVSVMSHFAAGLAHSAPLAYATMAIAPSYLLMVTLAIGLYAHRQRLRLLGKLRDWRLQNRSLEPTLQHRK